MTCVIGLRCLEDPDGLSKFLVDLCDDVVIRLPHDIRGGAKAVPLPHTPAASNVLAVRRTVEVMNSCILHDIFGHRSMEKIYRTLLNTVGFECWLTCSVIRVLK